MRFDDPSTEREEGPPKTGPGSPGPVFNSDGIALPDDLKPAWRPKSFHRKTHPGALYCALVIMHLTVSIWEPAFAIGIIDGMALCVLGFLLFDIPPPTDVGEKVWKYYGDG